MVARLTPLPLPPPVAPKRPVGRPRDLPPNAIPVEVKMPPNLHRRIKRFAEKHGSTIPKVLRALAEQVTKPDSGVSGRA